jgi:hypothetical protein
MELASLSQTGSMIRQTPWRVNGGNCLFRMGSFCLFRVGIYYLGGVVGTGSILLILVILGYSLTNSLEIPPLKGVKPRGGFTEMSPGQVAPSDSLQGHPPTPFISSCPISSAGHGGTIDKSLIERSRQTLAAVADLRQVLVSTMSINHLQNHTPCPAATCGTRSAPFIGGLALANLLHLTERLHIRASVNGPRCQVPAVGNGIYSGLRTHPCTPPQERNSGDSPSREGCSEKA